MDVGLGVGTSCYRPLVLLSTISCTSSYCSVCGKKYGSSYCTPSPQKKYCNMVAERHIPLKSNLQSFSLDSSKCRRMCETWNNNFGICSCKYNIKNNFFCVYRCVYCSLTLRRPSSSIFHNSYKHYGTIRWVTWRTISFGRVDSLSCSGKFISQIGVGKGLGDNLFKTFFVFKSGKPKSLSLSLSLSHTRGTHPVCGQIRQEYKRYLPYPPFLNLSILSWSTH